MDEFNARDKVLKNTIDRLHKRMAEEVAYKKHLEVRLQIAKDKILDYEHQITTVENDLFGGTE